MSGKRAAVFLLLLLYFWRHVRGAERSISCRLSSACDLPCPFDPGPEVVIHWLKPPDDTFSVHSFYHGKDQLERQGPRYRGRTALFKDRIPQGNASVRITGVELADSGRYKCYTSTTQGNNEDFVNVEVQAPVSLVSLGEDGERLKCESKDIYPKPSVSWSPQTDHSTSVTTPGNGLFSVLSTVPLTQRPLEEYSCNVSTKHSWKSATYRRTAGVTWSSSRTELPCLDTKHSVQSLVWTFNRTQVVLEQSESHTVYDPGWERRVEQGPGSELILKDLSLEEQGLYSCSLTTDRGTYLTVTEVTVSAAVKSEYKAAIIGGVGFLVLLVVVIVVVVLCRRRRTHAPNGVL